MLSALPKLQTQLFGSIVLADVIKAGVATDHVSALGYSSASAHTVISSFFWKQHKLTVPVVLLAPTIPHVFTRDAGCEVKLCPERRYIRGLGEARPALPVTILVECIAGRGPLPWAFMKSMRGCKCAVRESSASSRIGSLRVNSKLGYE